MTQGPPAGGDDNGLSANGLAAVPPRPEWVTLSERKWVLIGIGAAVTRRPPSRPGEFHPEPLTDPDLSLSTSGSCHRAKAAAFH